MSSSPPPPPARLCDLSFDMLVEILRNCAHADLGQLAQCSRRFRTLSSDDSVWERLHSIRWRHPPTARADASTARARDEGAPIEAMHDGAHGMQSVQSSYWRGEYARRHAQDAEVGGLLFKIALTNGSHAWAKLLSFGMEVPGHPSLARTKPPTLNPPSPDPPSPESPLP